MTEININEYYQEFMQDIQRNAGAGNMYVEDSFFSRSTELLIDAQELETADRVLYSSSRGDVRVDGYGGMPSEFEPVLKLIITDFIPEDKPVSMAETEMNRIFDRVQRFLERSINPGFSNQLEETSQAFGLANTITGWWSRIKQVSFFLLTNRVLSSRVDRIKAREIQGRPVDQNVWDIRRFHNYEMSFREREDLIVDMEKDFGGRLVLLPASETGAEYSGYLTVISGTQLAEIYKRYTTRLLEKNVRVFLQARGRVNQGIRNTLSNKPEMFFAYNNGISTTAEEVETIEENGVLYLKSMTNFQIVNGGQTTASIYNAMIGTTKADLSNVYVQMKLSVIPQKTPGSGLELTVVSDNANVPSKSLSNSNSVISIGRSDDNDIVINEPTVSRRHATVTYDGEVAVVEDLNSSNGVYVNGERVQQKALQPGDRIKIDDSELVLEEQSGDLDRTDRIIADISQYANTQNAVSSSDFSSNHVFHIRMEEFSRRVFAPTIGDSAIQSKWFYERARGQYLDARGRNRTEARRRAFDLEYPKPQKFVKTDLAKFISVWQDKPHIISQGAQKNFADFSKEMAKIWETGNTQFNEAYYRDVIAKAIVFGEVEKLVSNQPWYQGGYRANVVAYTIAKLAHDISKENSVMDFGKIWRTQSISDNLRQILAGAAKEVHEVLIHPIPGAPQNVTEWAKQQACWNRIQNLEIQWPESLQTELLTKKEAQDIQKAGRKDQDMLNEIDTQKRVVQAGEQFWSELKEWGSSQKMLGDNELDIINVVLGMNFTGKIPTSAQCEKLMEIYKRLYQEGFPQEIPV